MCCCCYCKWPAQASVQQPSGGPEPSGRCPAAPAVVQCPLPAVPAAWLQEQSGLLVLFACCWPVLHKRLCQVNLHKVWGKTCESAYRCDSDEAARRRWTSWSTAWARACMQHMLGLGLRVWIWTLWCACLRSTCAAGSVICSLSLPRQLPATVCSASEALCLILAFSKK